MKPVGHTHCCFPTRIPGAVTTRLPNELRCSEQSRRKTVTQSHGTTTTLHFSPSSRPPGRQRFDCVVVCWLFRTGVTSCFTPRHTKKMNASTTTSAFAAHL